MEWEEGLEPLFAFDLPPPVESPMELKECPKAPKVVSLTAPLFMMTQQEVADMFHLPISTFSKRWRHAAGGRIWPFRRVLKIDATLQSTTDENVIKRLRKRRKELLEPVKINVEMKIRLK